MNKSQYNYYRPSRSPDIILEEAIEASNQLYVIIRNQNDYIHTLEKEVLDLNLQLTTKANQLHKALAI